MAEYLREKIWEPMGAEADATWIIDAAGQEATYCCLNAVLRDYARLGTASCARRPARRQADHPQRWVREATTVPADRPDLSVVWPDDPIRVWLSDLDLHRRAPHVRPDRRARPSHLRRSDERPRLVHTAVRRQAADPNKETMALWRGIVDAVGGPHK